ncbi:MAG: hypothetical protein VR75_10480 [Hyphomonadaceae bacterium BRH_c29]|nr:MAG: hypothetical protein VR75_10480 [Hyphomonadaceae bacterium BRH_c29]
MLWEHAVETNLDRLRRYAAYSCGSHGKGDNALSEALEDVLAIVSSAENANLLTLFSRLDQVLRHQSEEEATLFAGLGRWQFLKPLERRIGLLTELEGFSCLEAATITGISYSEAKALQHRARMKYADRFPTRLGLIGADESMRSKLDSMFQTVGYKLLWSARYGLDAPGLGALPPTSAIVVVAGPGGIEDALRACGNYKGPVVVAHAHAQAERISSQHWTLPLEDLTDPVFFCGTLMRALLFSD